MAYEANGQSAEAITVYVELSKSPIETIKSDAKRLKYGIESMNFMKNEAKDSSFSRNKIRNTFIDTTGLANIADNFDMKYATTYVDLESKGFYKKLSQSVVRSTREARQILLCARNSGDVSRTRVVQALSLISRNFDSALKKETELKRKSQEPVAMINGKPIRAPSSDATSSFNEFLLASPSVMLDNLDGEWRLQLVADKKGDAVKYFNTSLSWQAIDASRNEFVFYDSNSFSSETSVGTFNFDRDLRTITRTVTSSESDGASFLSRIVSGSGRTGAAKAGLDRQQLVSVDSVLCLTRLGLEKPKEDNVKD